MLKPRVISLQAMDFQCDNYYLLDALIHIIYGGGGGGGGGGILETRTSFSKL